MRARSPHIVLAALVALLALAGCTTGPPADTAPIGDRAVRVTTTTNFITDTVRRIGGDRVEVTGLMGPGVDPHLYRASAQDVRALRDADIVFYGGLGLEGKMADLLADLAQRQTTTAVTDGIPREALLPAPGGAPGQYDPHIWFDVTLWEQVSATIAAALSERDPQHAATYRRNLDAYRTELRALDTEVRTRIEAIPPGRRLLVTSHDAFAYFGRRYGIEVAAIQGISTAAEATTADVERVADLLASRAVPAVFVETSVPRQTIDALLAAAARRGQQARVGGELFTDAAGAPDTPEGSYAGMLRANAGRIADSLSATTATQGG
ncbi:metal ABC transporter solute-binding protein, Zn/Mn family [Pseudonocardia sp. H11422]|uniref:metal ABC transporter solute-binding protein, Zn/Mn family n=1 Tax=Pseudonocardia sp. H11422 TaxID=2835866 RepID=UPI0027E39808|nr:zinc ABC transporter substrate-binding protein [Pseudonocardia sp. H11422]